MIDVRRMVDAAIEAPVVTSFTRLGYDLRSRLDHWTPLDQYDLSGRVVVITGPTTGLGRSAAETLARQGATVVLWGRDPARLEAARAELAAATGSDRLEVITADLGDLDAVRAGAAELTRRHDRIDVLIHNAGALTAERRVNPDGVEATVASQVLGPFLLTALLLPLLREGAPSRVLTMSSGGMYTAALDVDRLQMGPADYRGSEQYARAKRAQVTLNELWAERLRGSGVVFHAVHPGWADTPGVRTSLPTFGKVMGPLLRTPSQGADTLVWLAADDGEPLASNGGFWLDRRRRSIHRLPTTRRSDTTARRAQLWSWCVEHAGIDPAL